MHIYAPRVSTHARLILGLVLAMTLSSSLVDAANAQQLRTPRVIQPKGQPRGVALEQALAAYRDAAQREASTARVAAAAEVTVAPVGAVFIPQSGILAVIGNDADNTLTVSRDAAGALLVNNGAVPIRGPRPTVANTALVQVFGRAGNDTLRMDEATGALPAADMFGGAGNDTIIGGSGADQLFGEAGVDTQRGQGGSDFLFGGADSDTLTGGDGDDQVFGEGGDDRIIWNPGDDTDLNEGGPDTDTIEMNGGNGAEVFTATANGTRVRFDRVSPAPFSLDIGTAENLVVNMNGGDDSFSATGNLAALIQITVDGGAGNDTILGSNGADRLLGGDANDTIDGQQGNDVAFMGAGDDVFVWDPGDGNDVVEGQDGTDTMRFNGSSIGEVFDISANGNRVRFTRNVGNIVMDADDVEQIEINAVGGADVATLNDVTGTDLTRVAVNLALPGGIGDGAIDTVVVTGTSGDDFAIVFGDATGVSVISSVFATELMVTGAEVQDVLSLPFLAGDDSLDASVVAADAIGLSADGGDGNDVLVGGAGNDTLLGRSGDDVLIGGPGQDVLDGGDGNNVVIQ
jgi:Ca2+-binding RTX toxin-like protein